MDTTKCNGRNHVVQSVSPQQRSHANRQVQSPRTGGKLTSVKTVRPNQVSTTQRTPFCPERMKTFTMCFWIGVISLVVMVGCTLAASISMMDGLQEPPERVLLLAGKSAEIAFCFLLAAWIVFLNKLHRAWISVQPLCRLDSQLPSPSQAVGFLFVPAFNFYWIFVATVGLIQSVNRLLRCRSSQSPKFGIGIALCFSISTISMPVAVPACLVLGGLGLMFAVALLVCVFASYYWFAKQLTQAINAMGSAPATA